MYAVLGDIQFDLITYFDGFEWRFGADYAEHGVIQGKPRLQFIGDKLDEIRLTLKFHAQYCDPEAEMVRLREAAQAHQAMAFVLGNGDYKGWFVLTEAEAISEQTDPAGTLVSVTATATLREYVGDKKNPVPPPAVQPKVLPAAATAGAVKPVSAVAAAAGDVRENIRQAVSAANQAQAAMRVAVDAASMAKSLSANPAAALGQVSALAANLGQVAAPLGKLSPTLSNLTGQFPEAAGILQSANSAATTVRSAHAALSDVHSGNIAARLDYVDNRVAAASSTLDAAAPGISRLASQVITRRI